MNQNCCLEILTRLYECWRRPELWPDALILNRESAFSLDMLTVLEFLAICHMLLHVTSGFFPKLKATLQGHRFPDIANIHRHYYHPPERFI